MQYGVLTYAYSTNLGDDIQSLAASQFLPRVDLLVERDRLHWYSDCDAAFVIFNGWFTHQPVWPPPDAIHPLFLSFFANDAQRLIASSYAGFFRRYEPIGCRSQETVRAFRDIRVAAYFSGCLTLTLPRQDVERGNDVYIVDLDPEFRSLIPSRLRSSIVQISHELPRPNDLRDLRMHALQLGLRAVSKMANTAPDEGRVRLYRRLHDYRAQRASELLQTYARARLVLTSRLHCALPCLALGTPVIFLREDAKTNPRFAGLAELLRCHCDPHRPLNIDWRAPEPNPATYLSVASELAERCRKAVAATLNSTSTNESSSLLVANPIAVGQ